MKTLRFKLYKSHRNKHLKRSINAAGVIYNHCIALHKRYYRMWKKHLNCNQLQAHMAKLRKRKPFWQQVGSQAVQDICQRIEKGYQRANISPFIDRFSCIFQRETLGSERTCGRFAQKEVEECSVVSFQFLSAAVSK
jgi:hypothetical protein